MCIYIYFKRSCCRCVRLTPRYAQWASLAHPPPPIQAAVAPMSDPCYVSCATHVHGTRTGLVDVTFMWTVLK